LFLGVFGNILPMVQAQYFSEKTDAGQLLLRALIISLLIHLAVFGTLRWGHALNIRLPAWMHLPPKLFMSTSARNIFLSRKPPSQPSQLNFVDVDPALAEAVPPKTPKFYSANNSVAANPVPKNELIPEIRGRQDKVIKTTEDTRLKPQPLQPSPPKQSATTAPEARPLPKKAYAPGDLVLANPAEREQERNGQSQTDLGADAQPQPVHERPRTIAEAMAQHGMLGEKSRQEGGVNRVKMGSSVDAIKTSYGDYDAQFIDAVRTHWYQLLENRSPGTGRVVVEFRLLPDGRVTELSIVQNEMSELFGLICAQAIREPAPYRPWPEEMRRDIPKDYRDVTFTFYYGTE
jgi:outer membrane biosynthesis protein TonB